MTLKLFFSPGTCSLAPHIVLGEAGIPFELERVDLATHKTVHGQDFYTINPKGGVPVLEVEDGSRLTEGPIVAQYIADRAGHRALMPEPGTMERYRVMEWQNYITSELHTFFWPLFHDVVDAAGKDAYRKVLRDKFAWVSAQLEGRTYLTGETFTAADAYLFAVAGWARPAGVDLSAAPRLRAYLERVAARPAVRAAMEAEGLVPAAEAAAVS